MLSALRGMLNSTWRLGLMTAEDYHRAICVESVQGQTPPAGHAISIGELNALLGGCRGTPIDAGCGRHLPTVRLWSAAC